MLEQVPYVASSWERRVTRLEDEMATPQQPTAFVTSRKGFCYLTIKIGRRTCDIMKIRNYTIDAQDTAR